MPSLSERKIELIKKSDFQRQALGQDWNKCRTQFYNAGLASINIGALLGGVFALKIAATGIRLILPKKTFRKISMVGSIIKAVRYGLTLSGAFGSQR